MGYKQHRRLKLVLVGAPTPLWAPAQLPQGQNPHSFEGKAGTSTHLKQASALNGTLIDASPGAEIWDSLTIRTG